MRRDFNFDIWVSPIVFYTPANVSKPRGELWLAGNTALQQYPLSAAFMARLAQQLHETPIT